MERNTNTLYILRFIASIMVVWFHFATTTFFTTNGGEAVNFFFFISGFVMVITNSKYFKSETTYFSKSDFYIKRFARIYPLYFLALLALAIFHYFIRTIDTPTVKYRLPFEILGIERWFYGGSFNSPDWTISVEFFFYLIFPFGIVYMRKYAEKFKTLAWVYYVFAYISSIGIYFLYNMHLPTVPKLIISGLNSNPIFLISIFFLGMLCGKVFIDNKIGFFKNNRNNLICVLLCIPLIFFVKFYLPSYLLKGGLLAPVYFVLVMAITSFKKKDTAVLNNRFVIFLGDISYGIYILQAPVMYYYTQYLAKINGWTGVLFFTSALILVSSFLYYVYEVPCKKYIISRFRRKRQLKEAEMAIL